MVKWIYDQTTPPPQVIYDMHEVVHDSISSETTEGSKEPSRKARTSSVTHRAVCWTTLSLRRNVVTGRATQ